jgi:hypothetical protein
MPINPKHVRETVGSVGEKTGPCPIVERFQSVSGIRLPTQFRGEGK